MKIYLNVVRLNFPPGSVIVVVIDRATCHEGVTLQNKQDKRKSRIVIDYIDPCLTSIYQPCDVVVNKPLKQKMRKRYFERASSHRVKPGEKFKINREDLIDIVRLAYEDVNNTLYDTHSIRKSF